ncbi:NB5R4-like protein [Mya arenaria]|uniref:NB5R4-like protein n=1 Tax=Mya arenaria TaxID=6604 RepID=A0ABY7EIS3_MYAAR|nr:NB5R4-like protein [Mya arenaria]
MGCASSSPKKWTPSEQPNLTNLDMGENFLNPVGASFPSLGSPQRISVSSQGGRNKVQLKPGHSLMDWIRLGRSGKDLTGVGGRRLDVTPEELGKHNTEKDCWLALRDAARLFAVLDAPKVFAFKDTPKNFPLKRLHGFDWYQSGQTVSVIVYTKCPEISQDDIIVDIQGRTLLASMHIKQSVYTAHIELEKEVSLDCKIIKTYKKQIKHLHMSNSVNISGDSGKVELVFEKTLHDVQWSSIGKHLNHHNTYVSYNHFNPAYRDCTLEAVKSITHDTRLYTMCLPPGTRMTVPVGHHPGCQDLRLEQGQALYLMVKVYPQGVLTPWLGTLKPGERIPISSHQGTFKSSQLQECSHLVMFAAGTGFTPMLLFFNKKEEDILWNDQLCALAECNDRFTFTNCLSEADDSWTGLRGRITKKMVEQYLPPLSDNDHPLICIVKSEVDLKLTLKGTLTCANGYNEEQMIENRLMACVQRAPHPTKDRSTDLLSKNGLDKGLPMGILGLQKSIQDSIYGLVEIEYGLFPWQPSRLVVQCPGYQDLKFEELKWLCEGLDKMFYLVEFEFILQEHASLRLDLDICVTHTGRHVQGYKILLQKTAHKLKPCHKTASYVLLWPPVVSVDYQHSSTPQNETESQRRLGKFWVTMTEAGWLLQDWLRSYILPLGCLKMLLRSSELMPMLPLPDEPELNFSEHFHIVKKHECNIMLHHQKGFWPGYVGCLKSTLRLVSGVLNFFTCGAGLLLYWAEDMCFPIASIENINMKLNFTDLELGPSLALLLHDGLGTHEVDGSDLSLKNHTGLVLLKGFCDAKIYQLKVTSHQQEK